MVFMWWLVGLVIHYTFYNNIIPLLLTDQEKLCIIHEKTLLIKGLTTKAFFYGLTIVLFYINVFCFVIFAIINSFS